MMVALVARNPDAVRMLYYAVMSTVGSVVGCLLLDLTLRPLGEKGLEKHVSKRRLARLRDRIGRSGGQALAIASLVPPPFPFTAVVMAAAALQYSRKRMLIVVGVCRLVRFVVVGWLALRFGKSMLQWAEKPWVKGFLVVLIVVCVVGSVVSVYGWLRRR
jgi:uncharacterized membrane protein YdjX (TVP38/TMEM64 family)